MELFPDFTDLPQLIFTIVFWAMALIQLFWLFFFYLRIAIHKEKENDSSYPPVSIVIAARNEEDNLFENLTYILEQDYKDFEVIVVNHQSVDNTEYLLKAFQEKHPHLKIINIERNNHLAYGKKLPLTIGIKGSKHDLLLLTDADCKPASDQWLKQMAGKFTPKKKIVLGYAPYRKTPGFLNKVIRLDTTFIALNYFSFAKSGIPYMGVGRNLAYSKELFMNNSGFKSHYSIQSGDDDLFIQEVAKKKNYTVSLSPQTFCYSEGEKTWKKWITQKSRHYTTSVRYPLFKKLLLGIYPLSLIFLYISLFTLLFSNWMNWVSLGVILVIFISKWITLGFAFKKLDQKDLILGVLFWELFYAILTPLVYYTTEQSTTTRWK
ncbi:MAG TPA: glycosyltransferase [Brumimicrobium sp.]|nr:glycosyltransferase [Brumimicrobium sp.]